MEVGESRNFSCQNGIVLILNRIGIVDIQIFFRNGIFLPKTELCSMIVITVLVVQEKSGKFRGTGLWKFPTGVVDEGEDICKGAMREVKEETGIDTEFVEVLAFRQSHKSFFDKSDLFFVCMLRPLSFDIQKQELEIEAAEWMPIEVYAAQPFVQSHGLLKYIIDVGLAKVDKGYAGFSPVPTTSTFSNEKSFLYLNSQDLDK
ncbi:hypothetical protein AQUCO_00500324v1 [Aquilegia coerulea]|uniref:Nudix hydrolase domain-containing protein n=1 Tax=Aquilegia coerulea TaxID=218851 RepID=A0A2G5ERE6_AQUCA|nr:hypothetical protein AQUCO_00500324v1 [Aquilegia coerulea]